VIKIQFLLKRSNDKQESLEYITISAPEVDKSRKFDYVCEVYLSNIKKTFPIYGINLVDTLFLASEFAKIYLQSLIKNGSVISEVEGKKP